MIEPRVSYEIGVVDGAAAHFRYVDVDTQAAAELMGSWGADAARISRAEIIVAKESPAILLDYRAIGNIILADCYSEAKGGRVRLYTETHYRGIVDPPPLSPASTASDEKGQQLYAERYAQRRVRAADMSTSVVEALSYCTDTLMYGEAALRREQERAQTLLKVRKGLGAALGSAAVTAASGLIAYGSHRMGMETELEVAIDGAAGVSALLSSVHMVSEAVAGYHTRLQKNNEFRGWPMDRRAADRVVRYQQARARQAVPELIEYELIPPVPELPPAD